MWLNFLIIRLSWYNHYFYFIVKMLWYSCKYFIILRTIYAAHACSKTWVKILSNNFRMISKEVKQILMSWLERCSMISLNKCCLMRARVECSMIRAKTTKQRRKRIHTWRMYKGICFVYFLLFVTYIEGYTSKRKDYIG